MGFCKCNCACFSVIAGIIVGIIIGILYALGFISTDIIFWAYLLVGVLGLFLSPLYAVNHSCKPSCFCVLKNLIVALAVGTVIFAVVGLIIAPIAPVLAVSIIIGIATAFPVSLLSAIICLVACLCDN